MNEKSRRVLRIVASLYLIYLGAKLVRDVLQNRPENIALMVTAGIIFVLVGISIIVYSFREFQKFNKKVSVDEESDSSTFVPEKKEDSAVDLVKMERIDGEEESHLEHMTEVIDEEEK